jgi:hypothetical protein
MAEQLALEGTVAPAGDAAPETPSTTGGAAPPADTAPAQEITPGQTGPEMAPEPDLEAEPVEETPAEGAEAAPEAEPETEPLPKDAELAEVYRQHPELKEFFKAHPAMRAPWFRAVEINKVFPSVEDASRAKDWALQLYNFDSQYFGDEGGKRQFLQALWDNSLDDRGQPTGHYEQVAGIITGDALSNLGNIVLRDASIAQAAGLTPEQAKLAINYVKTMLGMGEARAAGTGATAAPGNDAREQEYRRREAEITAREQALRTSSETSFTESMKNEFNGWLAAEVDKRLKPASALAAMPPGFSSWVKETISKRVGDALRGDSFFAAQVDAMVRSGNRSPEHAAQLRGELERRTRQVLPDIVKNVLGEAGVQAKAAQDARNTRQAEAATRREPVATATPGRMRGPSQRPKMTGDWNKDANAILGLE